MITLYRALLRLYPKSFRAEYGDEMCAVFERELRTSSGRGIWLLLLRSAGDVVSNAARVHLDILRQDLKYAARSLRRTPGFAITAILVAALGIGATTATFSIADHVLLRPLPFSEPGRLVKLWEDHAALGYPRMEPSPPTYLDWQRLATVFDRLEAYTGGGATLVTGGEPIRISGGAVRGGVFQMLGRPASRGRVLTESDLATETQNPIVISDRLWRTRFAAAEDVLGQTITLDDRTYVIVGVMPPDFFFPSRESDFWRLLRFSPTGGDADRGNQYLEVVGRLKDGISVERARAEMQVIGTQLQRAYPKELGGKSVTLAPWAAQVSQQSRLLLLGLVGASICVLLIASTNLANLLMSRALARRSEFAVRAAIGASIDRLVRQMLTDSFLLAVGGGVLGVIMAIVSAPLLMRLVPTTLPIAEVPPLDLRMLVVAAVVTLSTAMAFGVLPAIRVCRNTDASALKEGTRGGTGRGTERLRSALVVAEIVASVVLLVSVGLLVQALMKVQAVDPGFRSENVLTLRTALPRPKYSRTVRREQFYKQVLDDVMALPGVRRAAYISFLPMTMRGGVWEVLTTTPDPASPGRFVKPDDQRRASLRFVTPGFFEAIGTPILQGRDVSASDTIDTPFVAVVSQSFARQHYGDQDPIGRSFGFAFELRTIVGVAGDIRVRGLERDDSEPQVYLAASQQRDNQIGFYAPQDLVIRTTVAPSSLMPALRSIVARADPQLPITNMRTLVDLIALETAPRVIQLRVIGAFAVVAMLLAAIGIYGLLAFSVSARAREIGVRIALGAKGQDIMWMIMGRSAALALVGVTIGAALAYAAGRSMQSLLAGVNPGDITVFAAAIVVSIVMTIAGSILPAWRAVNTDPMTVTRTE